MRIAKLSAQNLIDTFGDNDFFNVVHVSMPLPVFFFMHSLCSHSVRTLVWGGVKVGKVCI